MNNEKPSIATQYKTLVIIWAALLSAQFLFLLLVFFTKPELFNFDFSRPILGDNPLVVVAIAAVAVSNVVISFVRRGMFYAQAEKEQKPELVQTGLIIACALSEAVSIYGLFLAFAFDYPYFFLFIALGIVTMLFHFPRQETLLAAAYRR